jgi:hypothetical protein
MWYRFSQNNSINYDEFLKNSPRKLEEQAANINNPYSLNASEVENSEDGVLDESGQYTAVSAPLETAQEEEQVDPHELTWEEQLATARTDPKEDGPLGYNKYIDKKHPAKGVNSDEQVSSISDMNSTDTPYLKGSNGGVARWDSQKGYFPAPNAPSTQKYKW